MVEPVVAVQGLRIALKGGSEVVHGIDFELAAGERLALVGESGSGKSVTALALFGLLPPVFTVSGSIRLAGWEVTTASPRQLRARRGSHLALVCQDPATALDPLSRVGALVAEPLARHQGLRGEALRQAVRRGLAEVGLEDLDRIIRAYPFELSGGQRQRVGLAMALACRPQVLVADEPTTALDVVVQADIVELLTDLCQTRQMALLFISHDIALVAQVAQRALVLRQGEVVEAGVLDQLLASPQHPYTADLVNSARLLDDVLRGSHD